MKLLLAAVLLSLSVPAQAEITCSGAVPNASEYTAVTDNLVEQTNALSLRLKRAVRQDQIDTVVRELDELKRRLNENNYQALMAFSDYFATCIDDRSL